MRGIPIPGNTVFILKWGPYLFCANLSILHISIPSTYAFASTLSSLYITLMPRERHGISNHCRLFFRPFIQANVQEKHQSLCYWPFVGEIHWWLVDSPHKGPVTPSVSVSWRHPEYLLFKAQPCMSTMWFFWSHIGWENLWDSITYPCLSVSDKPNISRIKQMWWRQAMNRLM